MEGRNLINFLVIEDLDNSNRFFLGCDYVRMFDVNIDLNSRMMQIRKKDRMFVKRAIK